MIIFELVGDWAGSSYITSGCPGTCSERLMNGANFAVRHIQSNILFLLTTIVALLECVVEHKLFESIQKTTN